MRPSCGRRSRHFPDIAASFVDEGSEAAVARALAIAGDSVAEQLRRQRHALALAVALADLSGEQPLEWVTATLSDFADAAMDEALRAAMLERVPDEEPRGLADPRAGQAWQPRAQLFFRR